MASTRTTTISSASVLLLLIFGSSQLLAGGQDSVRKELDRLDWQPTWAVPGTQYVGREICAECHAETAAAQKTSAMGAALALPAESSVLQQHPRLTFGQGPYRYTVEREKNIVSYTLSDGAHTVSVPVSWVFGYGMAEIGQTYLLFYSGSYYESRVSFFTTLQGLDITLGHSSAVPASLLDALGRVVKPEELRTCFGCHATSAVSNGRLQLDRLVAGITCEGCHGPGAEHVAAVKSRSLQQLHIFNPATLGAGDLVKFCGACHRTRAHVEELHVQGTLTVRFQPYRLTESRCFSTRDRRISCVACHDPHRNPEHEPGFYDSKCLACHGSRKRKELTEAAVPGCPLASSRCVTCHMPKYALAGSHFKFTDHKIRVVRLGDTFD